VAPRRDDEVLRRSDVTERAGADRRYRERAIDSRAGSLSRWVRYHCSVTPIVLATLNARWLHASFGLRCLKAALGPLRDRCAVIEGTLEDRPVDFVERLLAHEPRVIGLGVYVWNAELSLDVARLVKKLRPDVVLVVGGPEVTHEIEAQELCALADHVVKGEGEDAFRNVCERVLAPAALPMVQERIIDGGKPDLARIALPYALYDDVDLKDRVVYVEASRGCPFTCSFCLSALDDGVRTYPLDAFLREMGALYERGLRRFKFVDRTFNLKIDDASRILDFFLERVAASPATAATPASAHAMTGGTPVPPGALSPPELFVHFEMIPDRLPDALRDRLAKFPPGCVQLEVGIQTFDDETCKRIARRQDNARVEENLRFLAAHTGVHVHADLIAGLPGEDLASFGRGFDRLLALGPEEIQVGILKRLRGAPLVADAARHPEWQLLFDDAPPYTVLRTSALSFHDVQRISRFARAFDLVHNSGRFPSTSRLLFTTDDTPFSSFLAFSDWLFASAGTRHGIALARLSALVRTYLVDVAHADALTVDQALERDLGRDKVSHLPKRQARALASNRAQS
jgi:radical SAM superfamily enzyme YgiQ (UPF0313 family)